jgi:hypothetical protein
MRKKFKRKKKRKKKEKPDLYTWFSVCSQKYILKEG